MGRNQCKKNETIKNQNLSLPPQDHDSPAREQSWTENDCDEMTELDFRKWTIRNFCELTEHVLAQCIETKNLEKRFDKFLMRQFREEYVN